jgi:hypothetical protein
MYTIVLPTRGVGDAYRIFLNYAIPLYEKYLDKNNLFEFIIICPFENIQRVENDLINSSTINFTFYNDEMFVTDNINNWAKQQVIKLLVSRFIQTNYYFIIDDDMLLTKPLYLKDFFDDNMRIYYSFEGWSDNGPLFQNNSIWLIKSAEIIGIDIESQKKRKDIMGVTPQMFITDVVIELIESLSNNLQSYISKDIASEFQLYWCYLIKNNLTHLYTPSNKFFTVDKSIHVIDYYNSTNDLIERIKKGYETKQNFFIVIQSHLKYSYKILSLAIYEALKMDNLFQHSP